MEMEPDKPNMARGYIVDRAIDDAALACEVTLRTETCSQMQVRASRLILCLILEYMSQMFFRGYLDEGKEPGAAIFSVGGLPPKVDNVSASR